MNRKLREGGEGLGGACLIAVSIVTPFLRRWGATDAEVSQALPGDEVVPHPRGGFTQAITIDAPTELVWPWVAQVGQGWGGFYSYDFLENMVGCDIHSADSLIAEYRHDQESEGLWLHPKVPPIPLKAFGPGKTLVFGGQMDPTTPVVWGYVFEKGGNNSTRLIARWRFDCKRGIRNRIDYNGLVGPISTVMQRKMLLGIKKRAEHAAKLRSRPGAES